MGPSSPLALWAVANRGVTMDAVRCLAVGRAVPEDVVNQVVVTVDAVGLKDLQAHRPETDRLREVLQCEALGVPEAVLGLDQVLGNYLLGDVAVVAGGHCVMTRLLPAVVL